METADRYLVFRLEEIGFVLHLEPLQEILEEVSIEPHQEPDVAEITMALQYRGKRIPAFDFRPSLDMASENVLTSAIVLCVGGELKAFLVEAVEGIFKGGDLIKMELPPLLVERTRPWFEQLLLKNGEPLVLCTPERWVKELARS